MKKRMFLAAAVVLGLMTVGCGQREGGQETAAVIQEEKTQEAMPGGTEGQTEDGQKETTAQKNDTQQETSAGNTGEERPEAGGYEDNFAVDSRTAEDFALKVKAAVAGKDLEALADLTAFPVYVGLPEAGVVETREGFLALGAEAVFTEGLSASVEGADVSGLEPSMAGFSISDGGSANINFGVRDGGLAINGINY